MTRTKLEIFCQSTCLPVYNLAKKKGGSAYVKYKYTFGLKIIVRWIVSLQNTSVNNSAFIPFFFSGKSNKQWRCVEEILIFEHQHLLFYFPDYPRLTRIKPLKLYNKMIWYCRVLLSIGLLSFNAFISCVSKCVCSIWCAQFLYLE